MSRIIIDKIMIMVYNINMLVSNQFEEALNRIKESFLMFTKNREEDPNFNSLLEELKKSLGKENSFVETYTFLLSVLFSNTFYRAKNEVERFEEVLNAYFNEHVPTLSFREWKELISRMDKFFDSSKFYPCRGFVEFKRKFICEEFLEKAPHLQMTAEEISWTTKRFPPEKINSIRNKN